MTWFRRILDLFRPLRRPEPSPAEPSPGPDPPALPPEATPDVDALLDLHNFERERNGRHALSRHADVERAAQLHAEWMAAHRRMSHVGNGGSSFGDRLRSEGYRYRAGGENVAAGYATAKSVFEAWLESPGHRRNVLDARYVHVGLGVASDGAGRRYWCAVFARPTYVEGSFVVELVEQLPEPLEGDEC